MLTTLNTQQHGASAPARQAAQVSYVSRGRPRDPQTNATILQATLEELSKGYRSLTIEAVARRAGVARTTIYRRYRDKSELVTAAMELASQPQPPTMTEDTVANLRMFTREMFRAPLLNPQRFAAMMHLFAEAPFDEAAKGVVQTLGMPLNDRLTQLIETGRQRGQIPADFDVEVLVNLLLGFLPFWVMIRGFEVTEDLADRVIDMLFYSAIASRTERATSTARESPALTQRRNTLPIASVDEQSPVDQNVLEFADELGTSVGKALAIIKAFDSGAPTLGVSEIARRVNLPKSTAFRLLGTLERNGFVERRGSGYCIGRRLFELGNLTWYCRPRSLRDVALPFMVELVENTHQTVHLAVLDGTDVLYVEKLYGHTSVTAPSYVGGRVPARCAAIGKAMIAFSGEHVVDEVLAQPIERRTSYTNVDDRLFVQELDRIRASGVAFDHEEARLGLTCVGAPIRRRDQTIAAISIAGQTARFDPKQVTTNLLRISAAITKQLSS